MAAALRTAFVTGGSGFIGGRLVRRLVGDGVAVRALARSDTSAAAVGELGAEPVLADLGDAQAIAAGAEGCDVAFHLAAHVEGWGPIEEFERINIGGTRNALEGCARAGVRRFVHCGTEAALMAGEPLVQVDETAPLRPDSPAPYPSTKAKAEQAVRDANRDGFETVVLRPRFAWGAGGQNLTATTHVDNVAEGLVLAAQRGAPGEPYFVTDGEPVVFREFVSAMLKTQGIEPPDRTLPKWLAGAVSSAGEAAWRVLPLKGQPPLTRFTYWVLTQECTIDISKARSELGYEPIRSREEGLAELSAAAAT